MNLFDKTSLECSKVITKSYSTSFSLGIRTLDKKFRDPVYAVYGFVRFADEIVDTFHDYDKHDLLERFESETYRAIDEKISLNPVLHSFQMVIHQYRIDMSLVDAFLRSMRMDLHQNSYSRGGYEEYIYGSAEVVGLMCLRIFTDGDDKQFEDLKAPAKRLGAAFQKVNFLRDIRSDYFDRGRVYFPGIDFTNFRNIDKKKIEADIEEDFKAAYEGIIRLPKGARKGVYLSYIYYRKLFEKIKRLPAETILHQRIRIHDFKKLILLFPVLFKNSFRAA
jgi:phytoene/squalene synthetase